MVCCWKCLVADHKNKPLYKFTQDEVERFPLQYLIDRVEPLELLYTWHMLPAEYRGNFRLQIQLPCFVHYNRPEWMDHVDGPPSSQANCYMCNSELQKNKSFN